MRRILFLLGLLLAWETSAFATWSVIAVDRSTGRVVISSSTCTGSTDDFLKDEEAAIPKQLDTVLEFAGRAYRRPLAEREKAELLALYQAIRKKGVRSSP